MNELTTKTTAIQEYSVTEAALANLATRYRDAKFDCDDQQGMEQAKYARNELRRYRIDLETLRKQIKDPALRRCQLIDSEAKRISSALEFLETPIQSQIDDVEQRERRRLIAERDAEVAAEEAKARAEKEAEAKRMADERAELDRQRKELEERERESRAKIEAEEKTASEKREAQDAVRREEVRKEEEGRRAAEDAERKKRAKIEAEERKLREERESIEREKRRIAQEGLDADSALVSFKKRFGHLTKYAKVVIEIDALKIETGMGAQ